VRTLGAELCRRRQWSTTLGARPGQRRSAFLAELRARLVLVLAAGAFHWPDLPKRRPVRLLPRQEWTERTWRLLEGQGSPLASIGVLDASSSARLLGGLIHTSIGTCRWLGKPAGEALRVCRVGRGESGRPRSYALLGQTVMHVRRCQQAEADMMVFRVVPREEDVAVGRGVWIETNRSGNAARYFSVLNWASENGLSFET
jgi:hypothetical protein